MTLQCCNRRTHMGGTLHMYLETFFLSFGVQVFIAESKKTYWDLDCSAFCTDQDDVWMQPKKKRNAAAMSAGHGHVGQMLGIVPPQDSPAQPPELVQADSTSVTNQAATSVATVTPVQPVVPAAVTPVQRAAATHVQPVVPAAAVTPVQPFAVTSVQPPVVPAAAVTPVQPVVPAAAVTPVQPAAATSVQPPVVHAAAVTPVQPAAATSVQPSVVHALRRTLSSLICVLDTCQAACGACSCSDTSPAACVVLDSSVHTSPSLSSCSGDTCPCSCGSVEGCCPPTSTWRMIVRVTAAAFRQIWRNTCLQMRSSMCLHQTHAPFVWTRWRWERRWRHCRVHMCATMSA